MTIFRFKETFIKGRKKRPMMTKVWNVFAVLALIAFFVGPSYLAPEIYGTSTPSGDQLKSARAIICGVILAPFIVLLAWMMWQSRGAEAAWVNRRTGARLDDPSKRSEKGE